ncbi:MAG: LuxR family transcriptional regulator [Bacteroidales bacterium]|nr:LuxR family transcriptional regulator [Bacteroidales bacterium]
MFLFFAMLVAVIPHEMYSSYCSKEVVDSVYNEFRIQAKDEFGKDASIGADYLMADWAYGVSLLDLADYFIDNALDSEMSDEVLRADCLSLASAVARLRGDLTSAIGYAEECLEIDRASGIADNISSSLNNIAGLYMTYGDAVKARKYIDEAIAIEEGLGRRAYLAVRYGVAAEIYLHLDLHDEALAYAEKAFELDSLDNRTGKIAVRRSQMVEVLMDMGRDKEALVHLEAAVPVFREQNNLNSLAISLAQSGEIYMRAGHLAKAVDAFTECVSVCLESENIYIESRGRNGLWQLYRDTDPQKAMLHLERYVELQSALNNDKATEQMQAFNVKYDTLKKEQTIVTQKQRLTWAGMVVLMLIVLLLMAAVIIVLKIRVAKAVEQKNAVLVKANIDKDRILALSRENISKEVSTELEEIASHNVDMPEIHLTAREMEIAELCAKGMISKEIAVKLGISQRTVETHKNNIFKKLGINNTIELMRYMQMRFVEEQK